MCGAKFVSAMNMLLRVTSHAKERLACPCSNLWEAQTTTKHSVLRHFTGNEHKIAVEHEGTKSQEQRITLDRYIFFSIFYPLAAICFKITLHVQSKAFILYYHLNMNFWFKYVTTFFPTYLSEWFFLLKRIFIILRENIHNSKNYEQRNKSSTSMFVKMKKKNKHECWCCITQPILWELHALILQYSLYI